MGQVFFFYIHTVCFHNLPYTHSARFVVIFSFLYAAKQSTINMP
jgi:hypothetical protein